jgi:hypothetical protein
MRLMARWVMSMPIHAADRPDRFRPQDVAGPADHRGDQDQHQGLQHQSAFPIAASTLFSTD